MRRPFGTARYSPRTARSARCMRQEWRRMGKSFKLGWECSFRPTRNVDTHLKEIPEVTEAPYISVKLISYPNDKFQLLALFHVKNLTYEVEIIEPLHNFVAYSLSPS